ncbi:hypothetical protein [Acanthopleuribacter pedis]|uniref:Globin n=1 Tax=Acanthopleuribacter pedis TaxID=442870 RepID=A0A8J7Q525_9BACT|nr:hypothetical protein [Acanthopleuribacter pedis]MBO1318144.1 hypothetical protein [Acanthopleuribacter pedis]
MRPPHPVYESLIRITNESHAGWRFFLGTFYSRFMNESPEIRDMFDGIDIERQIQMLQISLQAILHVGSQSDIPIGFEELAEKHGPDGLNVQVRHFHMWMNCFLATVEELDPDCDSRTMKAWRHALQTGIDYMVRLSGVAGESRVFE